MLKRGGGEGGGWGFQGGLKRKGGSGNDSRAEIGKRNYSRLTS
jgi:hypothetical protein